MTLVDKKKYIIFSGTASKELTKKLSVFLGLPLGIVEMDRFANSEFRVRIPTKVKNKSCIIVQTTNNPVSDNLLELFFLIDILRKSDAKEIIVVIPYFGYSRQHINFRSGECVSTDIILKIISTLGADKVITVDFHNLESLKFAPVPVVNVSVLPFIATFIRKRFDVVNSIIVSPDEGGKERAQVFADHFFDNKENRVVVVRKERDYSNIHKIKHIEDFTGKTNIQGKSVILVDDICTTGRTLLSAINLCTKHKAKEIYAVIVHPDMDDPVLSLINNSALTKLFTTNTIEKATLFAKYSSKIELLDISNEFGTDIA